MCVLYNFIKCMGFPGDSDSRVHLQYARLGFNPWVGKIPWRREWHPTLVFLPGEFHGQRNRLQSMGLQKVRPDWGANIHTHIVLLGNLSVGSINLRSKNCNASFKVFFSSRKFPGKNSYWMASDLLKSLLLQMHRSIFWVTLQQIWDI